MTSEKYTEEEKNAFQYLENLRASGIVNMFGARPYLVANATSCGFDHLSEKQASKILSKWMKKYTSLLDEGIIVRHDDA